MTTEYPKPVYAGIVLILTIIFTACAGSSRPHSAGSAQPCMISQLLGLASVDLSVYEKIEMSRLGRPSEGGSIEYYYSSGVLRAIKSTFYGSTGKSEFEYYFDSPTTYCRSSRIITTRCLFIWMAPKPWPWTRPIWQFAKGNSPKESVPIQ